MKILVADDEVDFVDFLSKRIAQKGYEADTAFDGRKALELIKENHYDLVFVDHNMPELTGVELIKYIKENNIKTRTVMITGYPAIAGSLVKHLGADEYLTKPLKLRDIETILDKYKQ